MPSLHSEASITSMNDARHRHTGDHAPRQPEFSRGGGRVELQPWLFIVGSLRQHPQPDLMALVRALDREMGTVLVAGPKALRMPLERRHPLEHVLSRLHI